MPASPAASARGEADEPMRKPLAQAGFAVMRRQDGGSPCGGRGATALPDGRLGEATLPFYRDTGLPSCWNWIVWNHPVSRDNCHLTDLRLRYDKSVKRIAVDFRQRLDLFKHGGLNRKHLDVAVKAQRFEFWDRHAKLHLANALLYGDFPERSDTDRNIFCSVYQGMCRCGKFRRIAQIPKQCMCIKQVHHMYPLKHSNGSSKSGAM